MSSPLSNAHRDISRRELVLRIYSISSPVTNNMSCSSKCLKERQCSEGEFSVKKRGRIRQTTQPIRIFAMSRAFIATSAGSIWPPLFDLDRGLVHPALNSGIIAQSSREGRAEKICSFLACFPQDKNDISRHRPVYFGDIFSYFLKGGIVLHFAQDASIAYLPLPLYYRHIG